MVIIKPALTITWASAITRLTTYSWFDGYPSITQARNGRIWVVWSRAVNGYNALYYQFSSNMGYSWSTPTNLTNVPDVYENTKPSIVQMINGVLWVVWASNSPPPPPPPKPDFSLTAAPNSLIIPQGSSGTSTITVTSLYGFDKTVNLMVSGIPENVSATLDPPQVTPPPNGNGNSTLQISVGTSASPGNYVLTVTGTSTSLPPIARTVNITLDVTQSGASSYRTSYLLSKVAEPLAEPTSYYDYEIYYRTSSDNGASWSGIVQLTTNSVDDLAPTVLQLRNGTVFVFWHSQSEIFYKYSSDNGGSWVTKQLTTNSYADSYPTAIQTSDESIWVAWFSYRSTNYDIYYRVFDGSTWLGEQRLTTSSNVDSCPSILETIDGLIWMFWTHTGTTVDSTDDLYYSFLSEGAWSTPTQLDPVDTNNDVWVSACQIRDNSVWVAWASNRTGNYEIFYKTSLVGDLTGPENPISQSYPPDGLVNIYDLVFMHEAYGAKQGDVEWIEYEIADITGPENPFNSNRYPPDNVVSAYDLFALGKNYGKS